MLRKFNDGQEIVYEDLNAIPKALLKSVYDKFAFELSQRKSSVFLGDSFAVTFDSASTIVVKKGLGFMTDGSVTPDDNQYKPLSSDIDETISLPPPHATLNRIDLVCIKWALEGEISDTRKFKDATDNLITNQTFVLQEKYTKEILIVQGVENASPVAPAVPVGYVKLAELLVGAVVGVANAGSITDSRLLFPLGSDISINTLAYQRLTQSSGLSLSALLSEVDALLYAGKQQYTDIKVLTNPDPEPASPEVGYERLYLKDSVYYRKNSAGVNTPVGSGGGGGGGANWIPVSQDGAVPDIENNEKVFLFESLALQSISLFFKVPSSFIAGRQLKMAIGAYSPSSSGKFNLQATSTLIKKSVDAITSTTNQQTHNVETTNTVADRYNELVLNLTSSLGTVNGVAVAAGDIIKIELKRIAATSTEDTADTRVIPSTTEVII